MKYESNTKTKYFKASQTKLQTYEGQTESLVIATKYQSEPN